jgi:hypothetical protein
MSYSSSGDDALGVMFAQWTAEVRKRIAAADVGVVWRKR